MSSRPQSGSRNSGVGVTAVSDDDKELTSGTTEDSASDYVVATTHPDELLRHNISDEELEMFSEWRMDHVTELWFMALGGVATSAIPAFNAIRTSYLVDPPQGLDFVNLLEVGGFLIAVTALAICYVIRRKRGDSLNKKVQEIRERTKKKQSLVTMSTVQSHGSK